MVGVKGDHKMRLAFCLFKYFPYGGLQRKMLSIAKICRGRGYIVDIYTRSWDGPMPEKMKVYLIPAKGKTNHAKNESYAKSVQEHLQRMPYDAVVGFNRMPGLDIYYAADACYVERTQQTKSWIYRLTPRYRHFSAFEREVFAPEAGVELMMLSRVEQSYFMKWYETPAERFHILPPGISRDRMAPPNAADIRLQWRAEFGFNESDRVILMVGSNFKGKGLDRVLLGVAALPVDLRQTVHIIAIGKDKPDPFYKRAKRLGLSKQLSIYRGRDDVSRFFLGADLFVHPAHIGETAGNVILEAVASGLPALVTESCGYAHYVEKAKAGLLVKVPFEQTEFDEKLQQMLISRKRKTWVRNGILFAKKEDLYSLPEAAADVIESCVLSQKSR